MEIDSPPSLAPDYRSRRRTLSIGIRSMIDLRLGHPISRCSGLVVPTRASARPKVISDAACPNPDSESGSVPSRRPRWSTHRLRSRRTSRAAPSRPAGPVEVSCSAHCHTRPVRMTLIISKDDAVFMVSLRLSLSAAYRRRQQQTPAHIRNGLRHMRASLMVFSLLTGCDSGSRHIDPRHSSPTVTVCHYERLTVIGNLFTVAAACRLSL